MCFIQMLIQILVIKSDTNSNLAQSSCLRNWIVKIILMWDWWYLVFFTTVKQKYCQLPRSSFWSVKTTGHAHAKWESCNWAKGIKTQKQDTGTTNAWTNQWGTEALMLLSLIWRKSDIACMHLGLREFPMTNTSRRPKKRELKPNILALIYIIMCNELQDMLQWNIIHLTLQ